jgi:hypothetical protein
MRLIATTLLGLTLCIPVLAQQEATIHDTRADCGALTRTMAEGRGNPTTNPTWLDDFGRANFISGYIQGFVDAMPDIDHSKTGQSIDAACKYIQEHPEVWKLSRDQGLRLVLHALYGGTK